VIEDLLGRGTLGAWSAPNLVVMDMIYDVIGMWWWLLVRGRPRDFGGRCLLWPIKDESLNLVLDN